MNRRGFLAGLAAAPFAARAVMLNDYAAGGVFDMSAALRDGPVTLLAQEYECLSFKLRTGDYISGFGTRSRLLTDYTQGPFITVEDPSQFTDGVILRDFDIVATAKGGAGQHGIWMPSCREWRVSNIMRRGEIGGVGWGMYGQRDEGGLNPGDSTRNIFDGVGSVYARINWYLGGNIDNPRIRGGTSNMNRLARCLGYGAEIDNLQIMQGAGNVVEQFISSTPRNNGITLAWYGNKIRDAVVERSGGWGIFGTTHDEQHDNVIDSPHNGGNQGSGFISPSLTQ